MKKFAFLLLALFICTNVNAQFLLDGICYKIEMQYATVVSSYNSDIGITHYEYSGNIKIPDAIEYNGQTYSVKGIGSSAFQGCSALTSIEMPSSLRWINEYAFADCTGLTEIIIPKNVNSIHSNAFSGCTELNRIVVDSENEMLDSRDNCNAIIHSSTSSLIIGFKNSTIPNGIKSIGNGAFQDCIGLTTLELPSSLESIGDNAFSGCIGLTTLELPSSLESIGRYSFSGCVGLTNIAFSEGLKTIEVCAFNGCLGITSIVIPSSVSKIGLSGDYVPSYPYFNKGVSAFTGCSGLESITVECSNSTYDSRNNCNAIIDSNTNSIIVGCKNTTIPNSITDIWYGAFQDCSSLVTIHIPSSVKNISGECFSGCTNIKSITVDSNNPVYDSRNDCNAIIESASNTLVIGCKETIIPNSVKNIGGFSFFHFNNQIALTSIVIPESIEGIGVYAFERCRLENVITKNPKTLFGSYTFSSRTLQHAMVYIPVGTWSDAVYDGSWYQFNNIREVSMETSSLSPSKVYTLMDANTCEYAVYDGTNTDVKMVHAFYNVDEYNPNTCWQILRQGNHLYLFNIGARKYASFTSDGNITLSEIPTALEMTDNDEGILIGNNSLHKWNFVLNNNMAVSEVSTINSTVIMSNENNSCYSLNGQRRNASKKGINIVRLSDGKTKKVIVQ